MAEQYLRKVTLDIFGSGSSGTRIENLRIQFKVEKTSQSEPNKAEIKIYNLSEKTRALVESNNCRVALSAGYLGLNPQGLFGTSLFSSKSEANVFRGNVKKFEHKKEKTDIITKLECGDGHEAFTTKTFDKGYPPDTTLTIPFRDLSEALGLAKGSQIEIPENKIANGLTLSGPIREHLDNLCRRYGLEWSIQNESLQIIEAGKATNDGIVLLNKDTGLVNQPSKTKDGVSFECLLNPILRPGKQVKVESEFLNGTFICRNVTFDGDSHQGSFLTKIEARI